MLEEAQGADVQGRSIMIDYVGEKSQKGARVAGKDLQDGQILIWSRIREDIKWSVIFIIVSLVSFLLCL